MQKVSFIISCEDRPGIVRAVTDFLFKNSANITFLEEHTEDGYFFMRVEWELENFVLSREEFAEKFEGIRREFGMEIMLDYHERKKRIGLFCSREMHCLVDILGRYVIGELAIEIPYVLSNFEEAREVVEKFGIPFYVVKAKAGSFEHEAKCLEIVRAHETDAIGLARYMKILSKDFIEKVGQKIINVHHSFLPSFVGANPYNEAYERGVKLIGATSHYVIPELDQGPIIGQEVKHVRHSHDIERLKLMGRECEKQVFAFALRKHVENKVVTYKNRAIVFE